MRARQLRHLGHLYEAYGYCTQGFDIWPPTNLVLGPPRRSPEEHDRTRRVDDDEWVAMVRAGTVKDAPSLAAYSLLLLES